MTKNQNSTSGHYTEQQRTWLEGLNAMGCCASVKETHEYLKTCPTTLKYNPCVVLALGIFFGKCMGRELTDLREISEEQKKEIFEMINDIEAKFGVERDE